MRKIRQAVPIIAAVIGMAVNAAAVEPAEIIKSESGGVCVIEKVYTLPSGESEDTIPKDSFTESGAEYQFTELKKQDNSSEEVKIHTETVTEHMSTNDTNKVISKFKPSIEITTEDGYSGILNIDYTTLNVRASGYGTKSYTVTEKRSYPNLESADTSLVPKIINKDGAALEMTDIEWQTSSSNNVDGHDLAVRYTADVTYSGTGTKTYTDGYDATAVYAGEIRKTVNDTVTYTAVFTEVPKPKTSDKIKKYWWVFPVGIGAAGGGGYGIYRLIRKRKKGY